MNALKLQRRRRGYSLPFVIMILLLLSVALASLLFVLTAGARSTESMVGRRKLFYACDGVSRIASVSAQNYFGQTAQPDAAALRDFICAEGGGCGTCGTDGTCTGTNLLPTFVSQTPAFEVTSFGVPQIGQRQLAPLDSGPFAGMIALQDGLDMRLAGHKPGTGWSCEVQQELILAKIGMFQFFVFSDQPYTDWLPGPQMIGQGRVHANGNLCVFGDPGPLYLERATASGSIFPTGNAGCRGGSVQNNNPAAARIAIVEAPDFATPASTVAQGATAGSSHFRSFSTRSATLATWKSDANTAFQAHLQDAAHGVNPLRLPVFGASGEQAGVNANVGLEPNTNTSRLLVDPLWLSGSDPGASQKFAFKADIRIINGVWFLRDPANPALPGTPIWSDHPGTYQTVAEARTQPGSVDVGQATLFPTGSVPKLYSMYTFTTAGAYSRPTGTPDGVISYGTLVRDSAAPPVWASGYRCGASVVALSDTTCSGSRDASTLAATRSGFRNAMAQATFSSDTATNHRASTLPINVDIAALHKALASCSDGELGSHFPGTCNNGSSGRRFNGVIFITATWPGSDDATPTAPPAHGSHADNASQPATSAGGEQTALPYPLCSGSFSSSTTITGGYKHTACTRYTDATGDLKFARPTSVRLFNARSFNIEHPSGRPSIGGDAASKAVFTNGTGRDGLTVATNLPLYVLGDANLTSAADSTNSADHWRPFLVAGDTVVLLSNAWNDTNAPWNATTALTSRVAATSAYNLEILAGWAPTTGSAFSGGVHNFPKQIENWSGKDLTIRGSLVIGWANVYARWRHGGTGAFVAPSRDWAFDKHLDNILNQPPGAPLYDVQATRRWKR